MFASDFKNIHSSGLLTVKPLLLHRYFLFTLNICHISLIWYPECKYFIQDPIVLYRQVNSKKTNLKRVFDPPKPYIPWQDK